MNYKEQLNALWDCFHPYDEKKTLENWSALIQEQVRLARIDEIERIIRIAAVDDRNVDIRLKELKNE